MVSSAVLGTVCGPALGADSDRGPGESREEHARRASQDEAPVVFVTHNARGTPARRVGASALGSATAAMAGQMQDESQFGGGFRIWGAPIDRLTLLADVQRRSSGEFGPAAGLQVRIWNNRQWALGGLGRYKAEGFAELEGEIELGMLGSYAAHHWHLDLNLVAGRGFEEEETDGEFAARAGYDVLPFLRLGFEGRGRYRLAGDARLSNGRAWDAFGGPQATLSLAHVFTSLWTGATSSGVVDGVGWGTTLVVGGGF